MQVLRRFMALAVTCAFAGCSQGAAGLPNALGNGAASSSIKRASTAEAKIVYLFPGKPDAAEPWYGLVNIGNTMYSTTFLGGTTDYGTLYSVTTSGAETVMHSFPTGSNDGQYPAAGLTLVNGTLYGTTSKGGTHLAGILFSMTPSGSYKVLYNFGATSTDCADPDTRLTYVKSENAFFGATGYGGAIGDGCVFKYSLGKKPKESVVYSIADSSNSPIVASALVFYKNALYGTTPSGGTSNNGTVFKLTLAGKESILYSFKGIPDAGTPRAALIVRGNALYGTTEYGGVNPCYGIGAGCGTVFKVTFGGKEKVLHSFIGPEGYGPQAPLTEIGGKLYGTTEYGTYFNSAVFALDRHDNFGVVSELGENTEDDYLGGVISPVISVNGKLYGTAGQGGDSCTEDGDYGCGGVYSANE